MRIAHLDTLPTSQHGVPVTQTRTSDPGLKAQLSGDAVEVLRQIGVALDQRRTVRVANTGVVLADTPLESDDGKVVDNEQRSRRPAAGSRQRPAGRKRTPDRPRTAGPRPRIGGLVASYEAQIANVSAAYPGAKLHRDPQGLWLFAESRILEDLQRRANFLIALPDTPQIEPRGWAFWREEEDVTWIGPRHTNFHDGSVCAFSSAKDDIWRPGADLRTLLDIYSVWALRHLHLEHVGRWPGRQYGLLDHLGLPDPYYRLIEFHLDELCSCGSNERYGNCCRAQDLKHDLSSIKVAFERRNGGRSIRERKPPESVVSFLQMNKTWPSILSVHQPLQELINAR